MVLIRTIDSLTTMSAFCLLFSFLRITLLLFLRSIGIDVPAVSVSALEDKSIIKVHRALGVETIRPLKKKTDIIREYGYPILSKEIAGKIDLLQHPSEKNKTVRHAIITGETGAGIVLVAVCGCPRSGWRSSAAMRTKPKVAIIVHQTSWCPLNAATT